MSDKEKIAAMWKIIDRFAEHMIVGCNTGEAINELRAADASDKLLLALGFSQADIDEYDEEDREWRQSLGVE